MYKDKLNRQAMGLLAGYLLQFIAGITLNLFVTVPNNHPGSSGNDYFTRSWHSLIWSISGSGGWILSFHALLALILVLGSVSLSIFAFLANNKTWKIAGSVAALLTVGAFFNGMSFIDFNKNISSMIMAVCWIGAVTSLGVGLLNCVNRASNRMK